jgi:hypothetical protein
LPAAAIGRFTQTVALSATRLRTYSVTGSADGTARRFRRRIGNRFPACSPAAHGPHLSKERNDVIARQ